MFWLPGLKPILTLFQLLAMMFISMFMLREMGWKKAWIEPVVLVALAGLANLVIFDLENKLSVMITFLTLILLALPSIVFAFIVAARQHSLRALLIGIGLVILIAGGMVEQQVTPELLAKNIYGALIILSVLTITTGILRKQK